jgi:hypothetical protein
MIYPHTDLKFRITITASDFNQRSNPWGLRIIDRYGRDFATYEKKDFLRDSEGRFYFDMKNVLTGEYKAITTIGIPDEDFTSGYQQRTDMQVFLHVNMQVCRPCCGCHHKTDGMEVLIERVWSTSIDGEDYLCDCDGNPILTAEGEKIYFINDIIEHDETMGKNYLNMKFKDFQKLIEGDEPNSEVNTIPEVMRVMQGISDDTTVKEQIDQEVAESDVERVSPEDLDNFEV